MWRISTLYPIYFYAISLKKKRACSHISLNYVLDYYVKNAGCREYNSWRNTYPCIKRTAKTTTNIGSITPESLGTFAFNKSALFDFFLFMSSHSFSCKANEIRNIEFSSHALFYLLTSATNLHPIAQWLQYSTRTIMPPNDRIWGPLA